MSARGFSLIELLITMAIAGVLVALGTLQFNTYTRKVNIEGQVRAMYADLMNARSQAMMLKKPRSFGISSDGTQLMIYGTLNGVGAPIAQTILKYPVVSDVSIVINFDTMGVAGGSMIICVLPFGNPAFIDSITIAPTMMQMGKLNGGACSSANFTAR